MNNTNTKLSICNCGTPVVKRLDSRKLEMIKFHRGQPIKTIVEYLGDSSSVSCEKCKRVFTFMVSKISKTMSYVVAVP